MFFPGIEIQSLKISGKWVKIESGNDTSNINLQILCTFFFTSALTIWQIHAMPSTLTIRNSLLTLQRVMDKHCQRIITLNVKEFSRCRSAMLTVSLTLYSALIPNSTKSRTLRYRNARRGQQWPFNWTHSQNGHIHQSNMSQERKKNEPKK